MKNSFVLYTDYKKHFDLLDDADKVKLLNAIFDYASGNKVELDGAVEMAFSFIKAQMDRDAEKYEKKCEKRRESGSKGGLAKARNAKQKLANVANAKFAKQTKQSLANVADTDNDNDTDTDNDTDNDININIHTSKTDYQKIVNSYNSICVSFPKVTRLTDKRKKVIKARLKSYSIEEIEKVFTMAEQSDFLKGVNGGWSANFDWLMNDNNMAKVLDGNYVNKKSSKIDIDANFRNFLEDNQVVDWG